MMNSPVWTQLTGFTLSLVVLQGSKPVLDLATWPAEISGSVSKGTSRRVASSREPIVFCAIVIGVFVLPSPRVMSEHDTADHHLRELNLL